MTDNIKSETPKELVPQILDMLSVAKESGKVKKGVNETTKSIERKTAQFVVIAGDVQPEEIVVHLPMLCTEKGIPFVYIPTKKELGGAVGIAVGTSSVAIENAGGAAEALQSILRKLPRGKAAEKKAEKPKKAQR
ncbi:MAG TPA: 50S ribosomal protein L7Ae [Candidatus Bilamarchaeaceae archaeon]|nr:50S ribosomal protein L7Ae [Candidatus Bilamarchaeaceae archaeon]